MYKASAEDDRADSLEQNCARFSSLQGTVGLELTPQWGFIGLSTARSSGLIL